MWLRNPSPPETSAAGAQRGSRAMSQVKKLCRAVPHIPFLLSILLFMTFLTIEAFIDASLLPAAYLAGGFFDHAWSSLTPSPDTDELVSSSAQMYMAYYSPVVD